MNSFHYRIKRELREVYLCYLRFWTPFRKNSIYILVIKGRRRLEEKGLLCKYCSTSEQNLYKRSTVAVYGPERNIRWFYMHVHRMDSGIQSKARYKFARPSRKPLILFTDGSRRLRYFILICRFCSLSCDVKLDFGHGKCNVRILGSIGPNVFWLNIMQLHNVERLSNNQSSINVQEKYCLMFYCQKERQVGTIGETKEYYSTARNRKCKNDCYQFV